MANLYTAYTKVIQGETFFFVKKFQSFPELKDVPPFLESFGMHKDFDKACSIAGINDAKIKEQILTDMNRSIPQAKIIELAPVPFIEKKLAQ
ncbi:MAG: hypothetical protein QM791_19250 [Ferruginibacter sp.]